MPVKNFFPLADAVGVIQDMLEQELAPIVCAFAGADERFSCIPARISAPTRAFLDTRKGDLRDRPAADAAELEAGDIFYITCIDSPVRLAPLYARCTDKHHCVYQRDVYSGEQWFEVMPPKASKANAVRQLARLLGCDFIVAFGDGINDIDMFAASDEACAVANAVPELKRLATAVIASNDEDGVAKWLEAHWR